MPLKHLVGTFNQEKALVRAFSVTVQLRRLIVTALILRSVADMQSLHFTAVTLQQCLRDIRADRSHVTPQHSSRVTCHEPRVTSPATTNQPAPVWCRLEAPQVPTESIKVVQSPSGSGGGLISPAAAVTAPTLSTTTTATATTISYFPTPQYFHKSGR